MSEPDTYGIPAEVLKLKPTQYGKWMRENYRRPDARATRCRQCKVWSDQEKNDGLCVDCRGANVPESQRAEARRAEQALRRAQRPYGRPTDPRAPKPIRPSSGS